ncbi:hypothetical protein [Aliterella atlantica]|uniref:Uncharacterized protein n=1 Tax=Aliterella atlantica CENA595 TaxID=1618023 RepID=A0A0D8ZVA5_9CYAN|nr:hypothetical protein [Aliterella atlantica]KJH72399.1 hypothetical protein UH38_06375 [Aliterella atlantica CENA595]
MSQTFETDDDLRPEYDFTQLPVVARGLGRKQASLTVQIDPDVAAIFPDSGAVNEGLRLLMRLIQQSPSQPGSKSVTASKDE